MKHSAFLCIASLVCCSPLADEVRYSQRPEVRAFAKDLAKRHGFTERELLSVLARARRVDPVLEAIAKPAERTRTWEEYRATFMSEERIAAGAAFWKRNRRALERAERKYGVPPEYVVAIIGVETFYGRHPGRWRVVDALTTLGFDYPPRASFFRGELEQFLLFAREAKVNPLSVRGSYAGAIGIPQFMPSSARRYAVDFDGSGGIDLRRSAADAAGSVAAYLKAHGWQRDADVLVPARLTGDAWRAYADGGFEPRHSLAELRAAGVEFDSPRPERARAVLIELDGHERPSEYRLGLNNFYALTRYNRSAFYAAAVCDLAAELRKGQDFGR